MQVEKPEDAAQSHSTSSAGFWALTIGSVGVVYGDIGTSPLYAFREALLAASGHHSGAPVARADVLGVLSLILWALILIVTLKYVLILLRADNNGEGGTLSLMALSQRAFGRNRFFIFLLGAIGASLFYGDAIITPAISVLSAIEGLKLVTPTFEPYVMPITVLILIGLFAVQSRGTAPIAAFFGPITAVWFVAIAVAGAIHLPDDPGVFLAFNPYYAVSFMLTHGVIGLMTLGAVFLAVTGAEALYADLGHFGRKPIQTAWMWLVLPSLALNYLGQGALVLANPKAIENPFYRLVPEWALLPLVILATIATIIASQAVITGAYSLTRQAIALGLIPRLKVQHTSEAHSGQIYMPQVNVLLLIGVILLVFLFKNSSALASAYGIAVTGTMVVTAIMAFFVIWRVWGWSPLAAGLLMAPFLLIDVTFLSANLLKVHEGGWVPLFFGLLLLVGMITWRRGTRILFEKTRKSEVPLVELVERLEKKLPQRVPGTAVFLTSDPESTPTALLHSLKHYKVIHEKNVILTIVNVATPTVPDDERIKIEPISEHFSRVAMQFGYMEVPNVPKALGLCRKVGWKYDIMTTSFFLSRRSVKPSVNSGMPLWQDHLYIALARNADDASDYFRIPTGRVVEIGTQITV